MLSIVYAAAEALSKALSKVKSIVVIATNFLAVQQPGGTKDCNAELITDGTRYAAKNVNHRKAND